MNQATILHDVYTRGMQTKQLVVDIAREQALFVTNCSTCEGFDTYKPTLFTFSDMSVLKLDSDGEVAAYENEQYFL